MTNGSSDWQLVALLREVIEESDAVPAPVIDAAKASFTWRTVDSDLAQLTHDSDVAGAALRSRRPPRMLTFTAGEATLLVEVTAEPTSRRLIGQLVGPHPSTVEVRHSSGVSTVEADEYGRFRATDIPPGMVSVVCQVDEGDDFVTNWIEI